MAYHFSTIDILASKNRISKMVTGEHTQKAVYLVRKLIKDYEIAVSWIKAGVYQKGTSPELDLAIENIVRLNNSCSRKKMKIVL